MADQETPAVESTATPEVQAEAQKLGWIPPTRFKGDPERFVDAAEYLERGQTVLPIVKEQNRRLQGQVDSLTRGQAELKAALDKATKALDEIEENNTVATQKAVENAKKTLVAQIAQASEAGDHEALAELTGRLVELKAAPAPVKAVATPAAPPAVEIDPELIEWNKENPWFGTDKRKTALALGIAQELRDNGEKSIGATFFAKVSAEMDVTLGTGDELPAGSKVEGGRPGSGDASRGRGKGFASLPADAKAACDADSRQFVGEGKKYKTLVDWRNRYAEIYFKE